MPPSTSYISSERGWASASGAALTITKPAGVAASDLLVAFLFEDGSGTLTTPSGWVQQASVVPNINAELRCITRKLDGTEPASWQFGTGPNVAGIVLAFHDANVGVAGSATAASGSAISAPSVASGEMAVRAFVTTVDSRTITEDSTGGSVVAVMHNTVGFGALAGTYDATPTAAKAATIGGGTGGPNAGITLSFSFDNDTPNAPNLVAPTGGTVKDRADTIRFEWQFSDPDTGDAQASYELRYRPVGSGTWTATVTGTTDEFRDLAGGTLAAGSWEWQVRTADLGGLTGPWSTSAQFTAADKPATPTITAPAAGATITSGTYAVTWTSTGQTHYQLRTVADAAGSPDPTTVYTDSGAVASTSTTATATFDTNGRDEHIQLRVKDASGLWSSWASVYVDVAFSPPPTPTLVVTAAPVTASITVAITNPAPGGSEPAVTHNEVWVRVAAGGRADQDRTVADSGIRLAADVAVNGSYVDRAPASGVVYEYRAKAVGDNATSAWTAWT